jgi:hypothetical protein
MGRNGIDCNIIKSQTRVQDGRLREANSRLQRSRFTPSHTRPADSSPAHLPRPERVVADLRVAHVVVRRQADRGAVRGERAPAGGRSRAQHVGRGCGGRVDGVPLVLGDVLALVGDLRGE